MNTEMTMTMKELGIDVSDANRLLDMQRRARNPLERQRHRQSASANAQHMAALLSVMQESYRLSHEGHTIVGLEIHDGRPEIELEASARLRHMANNESGATYICHAIRGGQRHRTGELLGRACRVKWSDQGE